MSDKVQLGAVLPAGSCAMSEFKPSKMAESRDKIRFIKIGYFVNLFESNRVLRSANPHKINALGDIFGKKGSSCQS